MTAGTFVNFNLPFAKDDVDIPAKDQAEEILKKATGLLASGTKGVAITYSANYGQTREIEKTYFAGGWDSKTSGKNQAEVINQMEVLLGSTYTALQGKVHILPITTMNAYTDPATPWNDDVLMGIIITDLARIKNYLESGWNVLGWQNQKTVDNATHPYAIGGGIATLTTAMKDKIQSTLLGFAKTFD